MIAYKKLTRKRLARQGDEVKRNEGKDWGRRSGNEVWRAYYSSFMLDYQMVVCYIDTKLSPVIIVSIHFIGVGCQVSEGDFLTPDTWHLTPKQACSQ